MNSLNFIFGCGLGVCFCALHKLPLCANDLRVRVLGLSYLSFRCRSNKVVSNSSRFRFRSTRSLGTENLVRFRFRFVNSMGTELRVRFGFVNYSKTNFSFRFRSLIIEDPNCFSGSVPFLYTNERPALCVFLLSSFFVRAPRGRN